MKKFIVFILAVLYLGLSTGATVHMHYCMGKLVGSALWHSASKEDKCSNCGMSKSKKKCCKDEHKQLQIDKDQRLNEPVPQQLQLMVALMPVNFCEFPDAMVNAVANPIPYSNAPPENLRVPLFIRNCVFRI
jgi:hypothetical protein